jgi:3-oxoacyl-[acyl-carrier-protein] synthase-3
MLFGDGAGAAVVMEGTPSQNVGTKTTSGFLSIRLHSDGRCHDFIKVPAGGSKFPSNIETVRNDLHAIGLKGGAVFRAGVKRLSSAYSETLSEYGLTIQDIAQVIAHQANARMLKAIAKRAGVPSDKMFSMIEQVGNTSSASLPIALDVAHRQKKFGRGDLILLGAFGGGLTWGTALIRW